MGRLERKLSEQNVGAPPSYEEALSQSPLHNERYEFYNTEIAYTKDILLLNHFDCRDGGISAASAPKGSSPVSDNPTQTTAAATTATSGNREAEAFDEFDPRGHPVSGVTTSFFRKMSFLIVDI